jgi:Bacterial SH3 domain
MSAWYGTRAGGSAMLRHAAAVIVVTLCLGSSSALAQNPELTIKVPSAEVHQTPSLGSLVIGKAPRGAVLEVTREVGDWVKVSWPEDKSGMGYIHLSNGSLAHRSANQGQPTIGAVQTAAAGASASAVAPSALPQREPQAPIMAPAAPAGTQYTVPLSHRFGIGGLMSGSKFGIGVTGRGWWHNHLGVQVAASRTSITSPFLPTNVTSNEFSPSLLYSLPDAVTDYVWVRPYAGGGLNIRRERFGSTATGDLVSETYTGSQFFGGAEFSFAGAPRVAVSMDVGYRTRSQFVGMEVGGMGFTLSGHWYVR